MGARLQQTAPGAQLGGADDAPERLDVRSLTRAMAKGDELAFAKFYDAYFERLRRYLLVVAAGNEEAASEALQSALVRVARHIREFSTEAALWGWLTVLARTALFDQTKTRRRYFAFLDRFTKHVEPQQTEPAEPESKLLELMHDGLRTLPLEDRQIIEAKYIDRSSVREIAERFQTSEKALESRLGRIRRLLKNDLLKRLKHEH